MPGHKLENKGTPAHQIIEKMEERPVDIEKDTLLVESSRSRGCSPLVREALHWTLHFVFVAIIAALVLQQGVPKDEGAGNEVSQPGQVDAVMGFSVRKGDDICSGHGTQHVAGSRSWCVCFDCWQGNQCEQPSNPCYAMAMAGDPIIFEDYWVRNPVDVAVTSGFKLGYLLEASTPNDPFVELTSLLKAVHGMVHNIDTKDTHFVYGLGGTHLLAAALYAQSRQMSGGKPPATPVQVWEKRPYFTGHVQAGTGFESAYFQWQEEKPDEAEAANVVEFVCGPNNPSGELREPEFSGSRVVWDLAYRWPFYTPIREMVLGSSDIALWTMSKVTGHAGTRFGWAMTKDAELAGYMREWVSQTTLMVPRDTAYRASALLMSLLEGKLAMFSTVAQLMAEKWARLKPIFRGSDRFELQPTMEDPEMCLFEQTVREPTPAYAWVRCTQPGDQETACDDPPLDYMGHKVVYCGCSKVFKDAGILAMDGASFGAGREWVRIQLLQRMEDFEVLAGKLEQLVA